MNRDKLKRFIETDEICYLDRDILQKIVEEDHFTKTQPEKVLKFMQTNYDIDLKTYNTIFDVIPHNKLESNKFEDILNRFVSK